MSDLEAATVLSAAGAHWEEGTRDYWNWNTDLRTTAIVLNAFGADSEGATESCHGAGRALADGSPRKRTLANDSGNCLVADRADELDERRR